MMILPTIEIQNGRCVSLPRGRLDEADIWHVDPVEKAREFAAAGAEWMHLTDFDAVSGHNGDRKLALEIIRHAGIPVQLAGGFRTREQIEHWIEQGAGRIVIGTMGTRDPAMVKEMAKRHPDQIVLSVDVFGGKVMVEGWTKACAITPEALIEAFEGVPLAAILITDIDSDVDATEGSLGVISHLAGTSRTPVIASGLVQQLDDISRLKYVHNIAGALVGRALFNKSFSLEEALHVARPEHEETAAFI
ncbi:1-(5-phosphoribosyl)-5-((5-phosphoribosylamino)methylideneamino)imidazole-4-carboxamide isomerase [Maritimibacter sp. 55A14]|uniref:1-(5-phosphoribosyl)-5-[(5- phosphoribosylamino)methylideneamino]imidazole-4- carboxamide isomerase n=1 Tax=Maritimibacter sp. 55A14 TaxID=2174844 RepID=UPI000D60ABB5|nr:1-(5-phosphoribosyl)-5-[(5-phosphoribosylamino)methylideneamino] imidazole-4-carboxamide isomerase [Maritimibacter sp. 55A14]PWE30640.1 1-(5-phosphoribosyl)-5-((5-phosphoribosylamino)methylideneamino)imidazole-4-carboxamide isomerase [Maritimibacter sp. 55A14]